MTTIPTEDDIGIDDVAVRRVTAPRTNQPPIVVRYAGAVIDVVQGPEKNTWGPREMVLCDWYDMHRVCGDDHDAVGIERSGIRPSDVKTSTLFHGENANSRQRDGCFLLRARQHAVLKSVPDHLQTANGFVSSGDYVLAVYESLDDMVIILDSVQLAARDIDRLAQPSFYRRDGGERQREASVEWHTVPGLDPEEMHARLNAAPTYIRALGADPDVYADDIQRVRERVADVQADQAEQDQKHRDRVSETMQT
jgi:hypothetical protein